MLMLIHAFTGTTSYSEIELEILDRNSIQLLTSDLLLKEGQTATFEVSDPVLPWTRTLCYLNE